MNEQIGNVTMLSSDRTGKQQYQCPQFLQHCCGRLFMRFCKLSYCCAPFRTKAPSQIRNLNGAHKLIARRKRAVGNSVVTCTRYIQYGVVQKSVLTTFQYTAQLYVIATVMSSSHWVSNYLLASSDLLNVEVVFIIQCYSPYAKSVASYTTFWTPFGGPGINERIPGMPFDL